uniref:Uncharacterized protein n=1 Tax=Meloidogyne incognita TaxID=6306 RepID=A0A914L7R4_MELIC
MAYHKIDKDSINSITNALDFFQIPPTNVSISSAKVFEILTSNPLTDTPYHFKIHSSQNYIDLTKCYLFTEFRIRKEGANGTWVNLGENDIVAPIQLIGHTFINNMKISINGRDVFNSNSLMAYKSYLSHELSFSTAAKNSHLNVAGYYGDAGLNLQSGIGFNSRKARFGTGNTAQFMAKIDADLFNQPLYLYVSISSAKVFEILTSNPLTDTPYHFKIHSSQNYIDLTKCYLFTEFRIRKEGANGTWVNLGENDIVAPIQLIGHTFINNMKISINGRDVFNSNSLMAYKSYLSHELSFSTAAKNSHLNVAGYYGDAGLNLQSGIGFNSRKARFGTGNTAQFMAKIDADLFNQPLYLINHCEIDIEILPNDSRFVLIAPPTAAGIPQTNRYRFEVTNCKLYVKKVDIMDGLALDIAKKLDIRPARYAIRKTMMKPLFISQGRYEFNANLFMDQIPRRIILGLVSNNDYVGAIDRSPFNFQPFNIREISIIANGRSYPQAPYDLDFPNGKFARAFNDMNEAIGFSNSLESNGISFEQYAYTHCIFVFNLTNSGEDQSGLFDLIKNGTTAVNIKFSRPIPEGGVMLIVMGEADSLIMLDKNRTITSDTTI